MWCEQDSKREKRIAASTQGPCPAGSEDDRDRAVVRQLELHAGPEDAGRHLDTEVPQRRAEALVQRFGLLGRGRAGLREPRGA
jgi:hypothetical protein